MVAYVYLRKASPEPIAKITYFKVMIEIDRIKARPPSSNDWRELMQLSFKCLWSRDLEEKKVLHFPYKVSTLTKLAFTSTNPSSKY